MSEPLADVSEQMSRIARELQVVSDDPDAVLRATSKAAVDAVPGAEYASVTLVTGGRVESPVLVGDLAGKSDALQQEFGEGPCIRAAVTDETVWIDDMRAEQRWPRFATAAAALGIRSMVCFCLYLDGHDFGALNLHSTEVEAFGSESRSIGALFAAHAATAFAGSREAQQLRTALTSRDLIGQAKGMLMERYGITADAAFRLMAQLSQESNTKLVEIAGQIVSSGPDKS